ncbi:putative protein kinase [Leptomonas seymouri]|uniref:non-specific serine/threonine protein kinase n=1 Tax=Leptomonas seymouri TaxID=5684 RepID=A0A0N1I4Y7_LEPSE|nr:putative protein kinase [Leptomonas seymouri]|eukprot:KPI86544.1 putative protein kinase [Leptomonas seymouri]
MALKRSKSTVTQASSLEEVFGMMSLCSWHTTKLFDAWVDQEDRVNILMEYCDLGNLANYLQEYYPLPEDEVLSIFAQTLLGLDHLHKKNIIHRDIKLDNILLSTALQGDRPSVKLADFGLAKRVGHGAARAISHVGTPAYVPPEAAAGYTYTTKSDIWSLGVVMYTVLANRPPFEMCVEGGVRALKYVPPPHPCLASNCYRKELGDFVMSMLHAKWKRRPSAETLLRCAVLCDTLRYPSWVTEDRVGLVWAFVRNHVAPVTVYAACSTTSAIVRFLTMGDQVLLSREAAQDTTGGEEWARVELPCIGYIRVTEDLYLRLDSFGARGLTPIMFEKKVE